MGVPSGRNVEAMEVEIASASDAQSGDGDGAGERKDTDMQTIHDIREHTRQIEKAVQNKEPRFVLRALRALPNTRRRLNPLVLRGLVTGFYTRSTTERDTLLAWIDEPMDTDDTSQSTQRLRPFSSTLLPEIDAYIHLLVLIRLIDTRKYNEAVQCSELLVQKIATQNRRLRYK